MYKKKVILVSGASKGLGRAAAQALHAQGHRVYGTSRDPSGYKVPFPLLAMDLEDPASMEAAVQRVIKEEGHIDVVVANAGSGMAGSVEDSTMAEINGQMQVLFTGTVMFIKAVLPHMRLRTGGLILVTGSMAGRAGVPFQAFYSAGKHALEGFVEALRMEVKPFGVQVALLEPGNFATDFTKGRTLIAKSGSEFYKEQMDRALAVMEHDEVEGSQPESFAWLLCRLVRKPRLRVRYTCGSLFERFAMGLKRVVPGRVFEAIFYHYFNQRQHP